jgi:iron transport multicopper oxidase
MDGSILSQNPIPPGESFTYDFVARDVGLYWYHPHMHEGAQIDLGLHGPILIHAPDEPYVALDQPLVLDDVLLDEGGIAGLDPHAPDPHDTHVDGGGDQTDRYGNTLLANGKRDLTIPVEPGSWGLFRLVNVANARYLRVHLEEHTMTVVGVDDGFLAQPFEAESLRIGVGERYQVLVRMTGEPGGRYRFINTPELEDPFADNPIAPEPAPLATLVYGQTPVTASADPPVFPADDVPDFQPTEHVDHTWVIDTAFVNGNIVNAIDGQV